MTETLGIPSKQKVSIDATAKSKGFRSRSGFQKTFTKGVKSFLDVSFPYDIDLLSGDACIPANASPLNRLWVEVLPNLPLAALVPGAGLSAAVVATSKEWLVNAQAKGALDAVLKSGDAGSPMQTTEVFARLTSVPGDPTDFANLRMLRWDSENSKLVSADGSDLGIVAAQGDPIFLTMRYENGSYLPPGVLHAGGETMGSAFIPANTPLRFVIENADQNNDLILGINLTYYHS
jgi:hypothetical protein